MNPLPRRPQKRPSRKKLKKIIENTSPLDDQVIPNRFYSDGCSCAPDSIFRTSIRWCCVIHDWRYCTRCHHPGILTTTYRKAADWELRFNMGVGLPWYKRWTRRVYYRVVRRYGHKSFDSCGIDKGTYCRHRMPVPLWMEEQEEIVYED